jgi:Tol biopolymer transport system component
VYFRTSQADRGGDVTRTDLVVRDAATGDESVIAEWPHWDEWSQLDWSPDGDWITFTLDGRLDRIHPDGTGRSTIVAAVPGQADVHLYHPRFMPDGRSITYNRALDPGGLVTSVRLFVVPAEGGSSVEVLPEGPNGTHAHYNWGSLQPTP